VEGEGESEREGQGGNIFFERLKLIARLGGVFFFFFSLDF
jgi:hypothetical protein